jgi:hypothetical protein
VSETKKPSPPSTTPDLDISLVAVVQKARGLETKILAEKNIVNRSKSDE